MLLISNNDIDRILPKQTSLTNLIDDNDYELFLNWSSDVNVVERWKRNND